MNQSSTTSHDGLKVVGVDHLFVGLATGLRVPASVVSESTSDIIFAHKNIANHRSDFHKFGNNAHSVLTYAVKAVRIEHGRSLMILMTILLPL